MEWVYYTELYISAAPEIHNLFRLDNTKTNEEMHNDSSDVCNYHQRKLDNRNSKLEAKRHHGTRNAWFQTSFNQDI